MRDFSAEQKALADHIVQRVQLELRVNYEDNENATQAQSPRAMVTQNTITVEQMESYQRIFDLFDVDSSGDIKFEELGFAIAQLQPEDELLDEAKLGDLLDEYDADGSGSLDFAEFTNIIVLLGVHGSVLADPKVTKIPHYGHDHLVRWLHDDGTGNINELGTGKNVPPLRKCSRASPGATPRGGDHHLHVYTTRCGSVRHSKL
jgi:hypothetical protein